MASPDSAAPVEDRPCVRPLEAFAVERDGHKLLCLRDPSALADSIATLPPMVVMVVQLFDGESTREQICAEFERRYQHPLDRDALDRLLTQLDDALLLD